MGAKKINHGYIKPSLKKYSKFDQLDGRHPWQDLMPEGLVNYKVRRLPNCKVTFFNFNLAQEMGLISKQHLNHLNKELEEKILDTFAIRIINEYDIENNKKYKTNTIKENEFMATRYLQLQHADKTGRTSGDGRCIWNGAIKHNGKIWDVSSRGTGVTCLAPGSVISKKPLESGNMDFGYGCGLAEIDELYASAIMSEIFHNNDIKTERMLAIIDIGDNLALGVRASTNLFRPAHLFLYLKQGHYDSLKKATDFLIKRQIKNKEWSFTETGKRSYKAMLKQVCDEFASLAAQFEREYIFAWMDWDGDNILANAGIIDYGSIRHLGLRHDEYRYDDVDRFSTSLNEQKNKARQIVQTYAQLVDFLLTKEKKPIAEFNNHPILERFDKAFLQQTKSYFLYQVGFSQTEQKRLMSWHKKKVDELYHQFIQLEKVKVSKKQQRVADGLNRFPLFNMRRFLTELPKELIKSRVEGFPQLLLEKDLFQLIVADENKQKKHQYNKLIKAKMDKIQKAYLELVICVAQEKKLIKQIRKLKKKAKKINGTRVTGNALIHIVQNLMELIDKGLSSKKIQTLMDEFITQYQWSETSSKPRTAPTHEGSAQVLSNWKQIVKDYQEDI